MSDPLRETSEATKARGRRNLAIAAVLAAFAVLTFIVTIVKLGGHVFEGIF
jgi:hypothetical protein